MCARALFTYYKYVLFRIYDTESTNQVFLWYRYGNYQEIPTDTDQKIPTRYTTLQFSYLITHYHILNRTILHEIPPLRPSPILPIGHLFCHSTMPPCCHSAIPQIRSDKQELLHLVPHFNDADVHSEVRRKSPMYTTGGLWSNRFVPPPQAKHIISGYSTLHSLCCRILCSLQCSWISMQINDVNQFALLFWLVVLYYYDIGRMAED